MSTRTRRIALVVATAMAAAGPAAADDHVEMLRAAVSRAYVGAVAGTGWTTRYTYDRYRSTAASAGIAMGAVLGVDNFGFELGLNASYDPGTTPDSATMDRDPLWMLDIGFGLAGGPTMLRTQRFELQLDLGIRAGMIVRRGCDAARCDYSAGEPTWGLVPVYTIGAVGWLGERGCQGVGLDLVFMRGQIGDVHRGRPTDAELLPPTWMVRLTWLPFRGHPR